MESGSDSVEGLWSLVCVFTVGRTFFLLVFSLGSIYSVRPFIFWDALWWVRRMLLHVANVIFVAQAC